MISRRGFLAALATVPVIGKLVSARTPSEHPAEQLACEDCQSDSFPEMDADDPRCFSIRLGDNVRPWAAGAGRHLVHGISIDGEPVNLSDVRDCRTGRDGALVVLKNSGKPLYIYCQACGRPMVWIIRRGDVRVVAEKSSDD